MSNTPVTPDAQLATRVQEAIAKRDKAKEKNIQLKTTAEIARNQAKEDAARAKELFGVDSLEQLQQLAASTYKKDLADVEAFEKAVNDYVDKVEAAFKQQGE